MPKPKDPKPIPSCDNMVELAKKKKKKKDKKKRYWKHRQKHTWEWNKQTLATQINITEALKKISKLDTSTIIKKAIMQIITANF